MLKIYDQYLLRQLLITTLVVAGGLSMIILLTQSLKLIELVLESNASTRAFFTLMALSLPRFFEAVLPASVLIATLFVFHRLAIDSEMVILRSSGASPMRLARPVFTIGLGLVTALLVLSLWISPVGIAKMQTLRKEIRAQYTHLLFREGIFNTVGRDLTAYVRRRAQDGRLVGLMVHDTRDVRNGGPAITVVARGGHIVSENEGQKIIVYDGSRQEVDLQTGIFSRLNFKQYTLDIPAAEDTAVVRWREPDERTIGELLDKETIMREDPGQMGQFRAELHRRLSTPLLMFSFAMIAAVCLLLGPFSRSGQMPLLGVASVAALILQGVYLTVFSFAKKSLLGCVLLYAIAGLPIVIVWFLLTPAGERLLVRLQIAANNILHQSNRRR